MSKSRHVRLTLTLDKETELGQAAKAAVQYMEDKGIDVKKAAFDALARWKKSKKAGRKKFSSVVGV